MSTDLEGEEDALALASGFTRESAPLWTLQMKPLDEVARAFYETKEDGSDTWVLTIDDDHLTEALSGFLLRNGAAVFDNIYAIDAHMKELERQLQAGLPPIQARDTALAAFSSEQRSEFSRRDADADNIIKARIASGEFSDLPKLAAQP